MSNVTVATESGKTSVRSPYHPEMPAQARRLGGKFAGGVWTFDSRDETRVRDLLREVYGTDGTPTQVVTVRLRVDDTITRGAWYQTIWAFGRKVSERRGRDSDVDLGEGVVLIAGAFPGRGGSVKNPALDPRDGTVLEIRDVPAGHPDLTAYAKLIEIVDEQAPAADVDALLAERETLLARLAEIDALLPEPEGTEATTREAATALGVSVRTVQRWAAQGKVEARKNDQGRWVITITI